MTTLNRLYFYMMSSGSLNDIYMSVFIKQGGMAVLRAFQEYLLGNKDHFKRYDFDEMRYIVSILMLGLFKHFKISDGLEPR